MELLDPRQVIADGGHVKAGRAWADMNAEVFVDPELSWLERGRVLLSEAKDESLPLRERVQRLSDFSAKLDQFYMRGVAALRRRLRAGDDAAGPHSPSQSLAKISALAHELAEEQERCFLHIIRPQLASEGIVLIGPADTSKEQRRYLTKYFRERLLPVLTPLAAPAINGCDSETATDICSSQRLCVSASRF
jgi:polyphosphate kinase